MLIPTLVLGVMALVLLLLGLYRGQGEHLAGLQNAWRMTLEIIPLLFFALVVAGMVQVLLPDTLITKWVGGQSGMRGILIGSAAGALCPGGPFVSLPIAAGLMRAGAGAGTMVAFMTGWSIWAVNRLPMEIGILGWRFTMIRLVSTLILPPLAGVFANVLFGVDK